MNWWILRRQLHVSWLIAIVCVALLIGVFFAQYSPLFLFSPLTWVVVGTMLILLALWRRYLYLIPLLIIGGNTGRLVARLGPARRPVGYQNDVWQQYDHLGQCQRRR